MLPFFDNIITAASTMLLVLYLLVKNPYSYSKLDDGRYKYRYRYEKDWIHQYGTSDSSIEYCDAYGKTREEAKEDIEKRLKCVNPEIPNIPNVIITRRYTQVEIWYFIPILLLLSFMILPFIATTLNDILFFAALNLFVIGMLSLLYYIANS